MKTVLLLLGTNRFSFPLLRYLAQEGRRYNWKICVGGMFDRNITERIKADWSSNLLLSTITHFKQCDQAIRKADLVIGIMPDVLLLKVADSCLLHGKPLISPSRLNRQIAQRKSLAAENNVLLLLECGFSPGLDHITAKKAIDTIHAKGGRISSFKTFSGSFADKHCLDNPWKFKLTEPAFDLINLGKNNNRHLIQGKLQQIPYHHLFRRGEHITVNGVNDVVLIPEGDSLYYRKIYQLKEVDTVLKGRLFNNGFERVWNLLVNLGLTNSTGRVDTPEDMSFYHLIESLLPHSMTGSLESNLMKYAGANDEDIEKLTWLGLLSHDSIPGNYRELTMAVVLHHLMEKKLMLKRDDTDHVIMQHHLEYEHQHAQHTFRATLRLNGENRQDTAVAKAIGFTLGAAAKAFLQGNINAKGLHIPIEKHIYDPILNELDEAGLAFQIDEKRIWDTEVINEIINPHK